MNKQQKFPNKAKNLVGENFINFDVNKLQIELITLC